MIISLGLDSCLPQRKILFLIFRVQGRQLFPRQSHILWACVRPPTQRTRQFLKVFIPDLREDADIFMCTTT
ncbi:hypothetical protein Plhal304r1_c019g0068791 [Plasmopara halstedii]